MYKAKTPSITAEIEQRIRMGIYDRKLPSTKKLQETFAIARQSVTKALRPLMDMKLISVKSRRGGVIVHRDKILHGNILIVSRSIAGIEEKTLMTFIKENGFKPYHYLFEDLTDFKKMVLSDHNLNGVIFVNSSLTFETAAFLDQTKIPFVSCNQLPSYSRLNFVELSQIDLPEQVVKMLVERGYQRIGRFYSGRLEAYNEMTRSFFLRLKRRYSLPHEPYDDIFCEWSACHYEMLLKTIQFMQRTRCFPQAIFSLVECGDLLEEIRRKTSLSFPPHVLFVSLRNYSRRNQPRAANEITFYRSDPQFISNLWIQGFKLLRERIFSPNATPVKIIIPNDITFEAEIPLWHK